MKTANQKFITFNEPFIQSYLVDLNLFAFTFPHGEACIKITFQKYKSRKVNLKILSRIDNLIANNNIRSVPQKIKTTDVKSLKY